MKVGCEQLIQTMPARSAAATRSARASSLDITAAATADIATPVNASAAVELNATNFGHTVTGQLEGRSLHVTSDPALTSFLEQAWKLDRTYHSRIVLPFKLLAFLVATLVDQLAIDGAVNGAAGLAAGAGTRLRRLADGQVKSYALWMGAGATLIALVWILGTT